jgi:hypothetical protein
VQDELGTCENCAREDSEIAPVKRMYVVPESWDTKGSSTTMDEVERWCWSCRTQYPHEDVDA